MPPVACPNCGQQNLVFFRSARSHCRECGTSLPPAPAKPGSGLTARVLEEGRRRDQRLSAPAGTGRGQAPTG
jgi:ribosomal protein S27E